MARTRSSFASVSLISVFVLLASTVFSGCSLIARKATEEATEKVIEKETGKETEIDVGEGKVKVKTEEGETEFEAGGKLPDDFPKAFPIYKGAEAEGIIRTDSQGKVQFNVNFVTKDEFSKVLDFYKKKLPESGYKISTITEAEEGAFLYLVKNGENVGMVVINKEPDRTIITVTITR